MLYPCTGSIQQYMERVESATEANRCRPAQCPQCGSNEPLVCHGFYTRTVEDLEQGFVIRVRRYFCAACRRTVSLLPEFVLPYLRFTIVMIGQFLRARLVLRRTLRAAAEAAHQSAMPYQRGQQWIDRFQRHAESVSMALTALMRPTEASDFVQRAILMLEESGWVRAHRFLFGELRVHLLGWPRLLAPCGLRVTIAKPITTDG